MYSVAGRIQFIWNCDQSHFQSLYLRQLNWSGEGHLPDFMLQIGLSCRVSALYSGGKKGISTWTDWIFGWKVLSRCAWGVHHGVVVGKERWWEWLTGTKAGEESGGRNSRGPVLLCFTPVQIFSFLLSTLFSYLITFGDALIIYMCKECTQHICNSKATWHWASVFTQAQRRVWIAFDGFDLVILCFDSI